MRTLKALGLALVAALAMSAMAASAASAQEFHSSASETILKGEEVGTGDVFTTTAGDVTCDNATYSGTISNETVSNVTIDPTYVTGECTASFGAEAHILMNSCDYKFHANGEVDIECTEEGDSITVVVTASGQTKCTVHIPEQTGLQGASYTNAEENGKEHITVKVDIQNEITYTHTEGEGFGACSVDDPNEEQHDGSYEGEATIKGFTHDEAEDPVDIWHG